MMNIDRFGTFIGFSLVNVEKKIEISKPLHSKFESVNE